MPDIAKPPSVPWGAKSGASLRSMGVAWLAIFGPRPPFVFSAQRRETTWQQWQEAGRCHGLARFVVGLDGLLDESPISSIPLKKPCQISSQQWRQ